MFNKEFHSHDNSTHIRFPDTIKVHEHKAPTDESIKLMEEMHEKALKNLIAKVEVKDNIVNGECYAFEQPLNIDGKIRLVFKFKINTHEFTIEHSVDRNELWDDRKLLADYTDRLQDRAKAVMLWWSLKMLSTVFYEKITGSAFPRDLLKRI